MKYITIVLFILYLAVSSAQTEPIRLGVGITGGMDYPIAQFDQSKGPTYGLKARVGVLPGLILEPNVSFSKFGDQPEQDDFEPGLEGNKITGYGIDAALGGSFGGVGVKPYGIFGVGYYKTTQDQVGLDNTSFGWSAGFGLELGLTSQVGLDIRGKVVVIPIDGGSKKSGLVTGGINIYLGK